MHLYVHEKNKFPRFKGRNFLKFFTQLKFYEQQLLEALNFSSILEHIDYVFLLFIKPNCYIHPHINS